MLNRKLTKTIISQLLIVNMMVLVGCDQKPKTAPKDDNTPKDAYDLAFDVTCEDIIQSKFPKTASNFHGNVDFFDAIWIGTVVADLPENDLPEITEDLNLSLTPDILDIWPDVLDAKNNKFWDITNEINSDTYYFEYPNKQIEKFTLKEKRNIVHNSLKMELCFTKRQKNNFKGYGLSIKLGVLCVLCGKKKE